MDLLLEVCELNGTVRPDEYYKLHKGYMYSHLIKHVDIGFFTEENIKSICPTEHAIHEFIEVASVNVLEKVVPIIEYIGRHAITIMIYRKQYNLVSKLKVDTFLRYFETEISTDILSMLVEHLPHRLTHICISKNINSKNLTQILINVLGRPCLDIYLVYARVHLLHDFYYYGNVKQYIGLEDCITIIKTLDNLLTNSPNQSEGCADAHFLLKDICRLYSKLLPDQYRSEHYSFIYRLNYNISVNYFSECKFGIGLAMLLKLATKNIDANNRIKSDTINTYYLAQITDKVNNINKARLYYSSAEIRRLISFDKFMAESYILEYKEPLLDHSHVIHLPDNNRIKYDEIYPIIDGKYNDILMNLLITGNIVKDNIGECSICFEINKIYNKLCGCSTIYCISCIYKMSSICTVCKNKLY